MTPLIIDSNIMTLVFMYAITTKWLELGPWLKLCLLLPTEIKLLITVDTFRKYCTILLGHIITAYTDIISYTKNLQHK